MRNRYHIFSEKDFRFPDLSDLALIKKAGRLLPVGSRLPTFFSNDRFQTGRPVIPRFSDAASFLLSVHHAESELHFNGDLLSPLDHIQEQLRPPDPARLISEVDCGNPACDRL